MSASYTRQREKLLSVYINWLVQRFDGLGLQEIEKMLMGDLPHLRDTRAGKDLIAIGVEQGIEKGIETGTLIGTVLTCQKLLGVVPTERFELEKLPIEELSQMADQLQALVASRLKSS